MKGILKGFIFTFIILAILTAAITAITVFAEIPGSVLKAVMWGIVSLCVFMGANLVSHGADEKKSAKGILCTLVSISVLFIIVCLLNKGIPVTGGFYALATIAAICGITGAFTGSRS